jgi:hypothetical protein
MKQMKKMLASAFALMLIITAVVFTACEKIELPDDSFVAVENPIQTDQITIEPDGWKSVVAGDDLIIAQRNVMGIYNANPGSLPINKWEWHIYDGSLGNQPYQYGQTINYAFRSNGPGSITLIGMDTISNQNWVTECDIEISQDLTNAPPVLFYDHYFLGNTIYRSIFLVCKTRTEFLGCPAGKPYFYIGNMPNSNWTTPITVTDTNYNVGTNGSNITLITPPSGEMGKYYKVIFDLQIGNYQWGTGELDASNQPVWANLSGSEWVNPDDPYIVNMTVTTTNTVPNYSLPGQLPGATGDAGENAQIRFLFEVSTFTIYFNNGNIFNSNMFCRVRNANNTWQTALNQGAVGADFPNWGKKSFSYDELLDSGLFIFLYGNSISSPQNYNSNAHLSMYWSGFWEDLRVMVKSVQEGENSPGGLIKTRYRAFVLDRTNEQ